MIYTQQLPEIKALDKLADQVKNYPESAFGITNLARDMNCEKEIIAFLRLFDPHHMFSSQDEFITCCEELQLLLQEERTMPKERLRSPQD